MLRAVRNLLRLIGIARTLALHDALFPLDWLPATDGFILTARLLSGFRVKRSVRALRPGQRLAIALQELGPSFIKFGQMLSTRPDLAGEAIADDLSALQDDLPPFASALARQAVEAELEGSLDVATSSRGTGALGGESTVGRGRLGSDAALSSSSCVTRSLLRRRLTIIVNHFS